MGSRTAVVVMGGRRSVGEGVGGEGEVAGAAGRGWPSRMTRTSASRSTCTSSADGGAAGAAVLNCARYRKIRPVRSQRTVVRLTQRTDARRA